MRKSPKKSVSSTYHPKKDLETLAEILQDNNIFLFSTAMDKELFLPFQQHKIHYLLNQISLLKKGSTNSTELHSFFVLGIYNHWIEQRLGTAGK